MNEMTEDSHELQRDAAHDARMTGYLSRPLLSWLIVAGAAGLLLGFTGATGSYEYALALRVGLWIGLSLIGALFGLLIEAGLDRAGLPQRGKFAWWLGATISLALMMLPVVYSVNSAGWQAPLSTIPTYALNCLVISAGFVSLRMIIGFVWSVSELASTGNKTAAQASGLPLLAQRLSPGLQQAEIHALKSEGHYVLVYTDLGEEMVLIRLRDAMNELATLEGMQVHRSWWVARNAVQTASRSNDGLTLILKNDVEVPVSRSFRKQFRAANWI